jgi:hypothetical protein
MHVIPHTPLPFSLFFQFSWFLDAKRRTLFSFLFSFEYFSPFFLVFLIQEQEF